MHEFVKKGDFVLVFLSEKWLIPRKYLTSEDGWDTCVFSLERREEEAEKEAPGGQGQDEQLLVREWGYGRNRERSILETLANRVSGRRDALRRKRHGGESLSLPFREISFLLGAQLYQEEFDKGNNLLIQKDLNTLRYNKCEGTWFCFCISLLTPASLALLFFHCYCFPHSCTKPFYIRPAVRKENNRHSLGRRKSQHSSSFKVSPLLSYFLFVVLGIKASTSSHSWDASTLPSYSPKPQCRFSQDSQGTIAFYNHEEPRPTPMGKQNQWLSSIHCQTTKTGPFWSTHRWGN